VATRAARRSGTGGDHRRALALRLRERRVELEQAILTRIRASAPIDENAEPEYRHGLQAAIRAAIEHSLLSIELGQREIPPTPLALLLQARLAARHGVPVGTVLRRYTLGSNQISDFIVAEAEGDERLNGKQLREALGGLAAVLEHVLRELEEEYAREPQQRLDSSDARLARRIKRCLAGEIVDISDLNYNLEGHHVGIVAEGDDAHAALRSFASAIDGRLLSVRPQQTLVWAWLGTREKVDYAQFYGWVNSNWPPHLPLALGEPGLGRSGWTLTHDQANEAFPFALRELRTVRYSDVALKAAVERDAVATASLRQLYAQLEQDGDRGERLRATLRAYLAAGRNGASAAAELGLTRQTVSNRLRLVEKQLGRSLTVDTADIELALWLGDSARN
jgi:hypothetical protein